MTERNSGIYTRLWSRIDVNSVEAAGRRNAVLEYKYLGRCFRTLGGRLRKAGMEVLGGVEGRRGENRRKAREKMRMRVNLD